MTKTRMQERKIEELTGRGRKALRRADELIQQTEELVKKSRQLRRDLQLQNQQGTDSFAEFRVPE